MNIYKIRKFVKLCHRGNVALQSTLQSLFRRTTMPLTSFTPRNNRKFAFTLAEVLITLGVIGVVAAVTMSVLINQYQKIVLTNQLKTTYSILSQGFKKIMADDGVDKLDETQLWQTLNDPCSQGVSPYDVECKDFFDNFKKYFKIVSIVNDGTYVIKNMNGSSWAAFNGYKIVLSNGAMILEYHFPRKIPLFDQEACEAIRASGGHTCMDYSSSAGFLPIDVNGKKGPNIAGRDVFLLMYTENGDIIPFAGREHILNQFCIGDKICADEAFKNIKSDCLNSNGEFCTGYLMSNWKMDY